MKNLRPLTTGLAVIAVLLVFTVLPSFALSSTPLVNVTVAADREFLPAGPRQTALVKISLDVPTVPREGEHPPVNLAIARIDRRRYTAEVVGRTATLTSKEMALAEVFSTRPGEVLSRNELLNLAWGIDYPGTTRTLDQHVAQLRKKIEPDPSMPRVIVTARGVGYRYTGADGELGNQRGEDAASG